MEKDQISIQEIAKECAKDYSMLKNHGIDKHNCPPRQWIRAWMQTNYSIIKLSGYFYREFETALVANNSMNESHALGLNKRAKKQHGETDAVENILIIQFEDPEVERICHEHGVYTISDAAAVKSIIDDTVWHKPSWFYDHPIKTFKEFKWFTGLDEVERHAFNVNTELESIVIPSSVKRISYGAFKDCHKLTDIKFQEGLETIETIAFTNCRALKKLDFPESLRTINSLAFEGCRSISKISIPDKLTEIAGNAFRDIDTAITTVAISDNHVLRARISKLIPMTTDVRLIPRVVNEAYSLGLNKRAKKAFNNTEAMDAASDLNDLNAATVDAILKILEENGFKRDTSPVHIDSSGLDVPSKYFTYTLYENTLTYSNSVRGRDCNSTLRTLYIFIDNDEMDNSNEGERLVLEVSFNYHVNDDDEPESAQAHIGVSRYDDFGWCGIRMSKMLSASIVPDKDRKMHRHMYLKNSLPVTKVSSFIKDIVENTDIDLYREPGFFIEDMRGIIKTIAAFQRDRMNGFSVPVTTEWPDFTTETWGFLSKHFYKNTKKMRPSGYEVKESSNSSLGLNKRAKKRFDSIDVVNNIQIDFVDLGLPSGTLWCRHNAGARSEEEAGRGFSYEDAKRSAFEEGVIPDTSDYAELRSFCDFTWDSDRKGMIATSKKNGESIFFPATGFIGEIGGYKNPGKGKYACYWQVPSKTLGRSPNQGSGFTFHIDDEGDVVELNVNSAHMLYPVRTVMKRTNESISLGLNKRAKKQHGETDAVDNISQIPFEDKEVECICHEHGVYTYGDAREVTSIEGWFSDNKVIKSFNELEHFTGLREIEAWAFSCSTLQSINIPDSVTSIGSHAFSWCKSLKTISIPNSVKIIGADAFDGCKTLQTINIPDGVTSIEAWAFFRCDSLKTIYISKSCPVYDYLKKIYPDIKLVDPSEMNEAHNLGLNKRAKNAFKGIASDDSKVIDAFDPSYTCMDDKGNTVEVMKSNEHWKNIVFEWLRDNVDNMLIKHDEKRAIIGRETIKVDDFIRTDYNGNGTIVICMYQNEFTAYMKPTYVSRLADYFNGKISIPYPLTLTAWNIGNYSRADVHLIKIGKKWRLSVEAYFQDSSYKTRRCPNGQWKRAKATVTTKDVPALEKLPQDLSTN